MPCLFALGLIAVWRLAAGSDTIAPRAVATAPRAGVPAAEVRADVVREESRPREELAVEPTAASSSAASASALRVRVVRAGSDQPIAGATVWHSDWSRVDTSTEAGLAALVEMGSDIERQLHALGDATTTDAQGYATLPLPAVGRSLALGCRDDEEYGYLQLDLRRTAPPADGVRLEVGLDTTLEVRTVDALGTPMSDVPIGLRSCSANPSARSPHTSSAPERPARPTAS